MATKGSVFEPVDPPLPTVDLWKNLDTVRVRLCPVNRSSVVDLGAVAYAFPSQVAIRSFNDHRIMQLQKTYVKCPDSPRQGLQLNPLILLLLPD